jgi:hypothetical protein
MNQKYEEDVTKQSQKLALSHPFEKLAVLKLKTSDALLDIANDMLDEIINNHHVVKTNFDDFRSEHNAKQPIQKRLFITPYLRIVKGARRNLYLNFAKLCSPSYRYDTREGATWQPRDISKNGKEHYDKRTLKSALSSYTKDCLPYIEGAEHCLKFLREETRTVKNLFELSRQIRPQGYSLLVAKHALGTLTNDEQRQYEAQTDDLSALKAIFDPLSLPKKLARIKFNKK